MSCIIDVIVISINVLTHFSFVICHKKIPLVHNSSTIRGPPINNICKFNSLICFVIMFLFVITNKLLSLPCYNETQITTCEDNNSKKLTYLLGK